MEKELYRGKTKAIIAVEDPNSLKMRNFDALTKFDTPELTEQMKDKAKFATQTTCNVFRFLRDAGIPIAFKEQLSETEFLVEKCQMIPLEVIARRYAVGSYLNRMPGLKAKDGEAPWRFDHLIFELFLKTTGKVIKAFDGREIGVVTVEDPLINSNEVDNVWELLHPKLPFPEAGWDLMIKVHPADILPSGDNKEMVSRIKEITLKTFLLLEEAWSSLELRLIDFKIEFGITNDGRLVVADVIDNDSWRLRTDNWEELSKQLFRDNADMAEISSKYQLVASLSDNFDFFLPEAMSYMAGEYEFESNLDE